MQKRKYFLAIALLLCGMPALAQTTWTQTGGPIGGLISEVTVDSTGSLLIGTFFGGTFESTNHGDSWHARNQGLTNFHIWVHGLATTPDGHRFAITDAGGLFRLDPGTTTQWESIDTSVNFGAMLGITATPKGTVLLTTGQHGILRSTDNGATWEPSTTGIDFGGTNRINEINSTGSYLVVITRNGSVYESQDDGLNWSLLGTSVNAPTSIMVAKDQTLFVGDGYGGIFRSTDTGKTWPKVYQAPSGSDIWTIVQDPSNGDIYSWIHDGHLIRSTNNGETWTAADSNTSGGDFYPTAIDQEGRIFAGSDFNGMYRSLDHGATLDLINDGLIANQCINALVNPAGDVFNMTERYVWKSTNRGDTWKIILEQTENDSRIPYPMLHDSAGNLFVGVDSCLWKSTNEGEDWTIVLKGGDTAAPMRFNALALSVQGSIYAATNYGLYQSVNGGLNWRHLDGPWTNAANQTILSVVEGRDGQLYWVDYDGFIYKSADDAFTWVQQGRSSTGVDAVTSSDIGTMFVISAPDLLYSTDSGETWIKVVPKEGINTRSVASVMLDDNQNVILSTDSGVYKVQRGDLLSNWQPVCDGLSTASQARWSSIAVTVEDVRHNHTFYAASRGQGVFRSTPDLGVKEHSTTPSGPSAMNSPNPFRGVTTVTFAVTASGNATLEVYNAVGSLIATKPLGLLTPGTYSTVFQAENLAAGSYPYLIRQGATTQSGVMTIVR